MILEIALLLFSQNPDTFGGIIEGVDYKDRSVLIYKNKNNSRYLLETLAPPVIFNGDEHRYPIEMVQLGDYVTTYSETQDYSHYVIKVNRSLDETFCYATEDCVNRFTDISDEFIEGLGSSEYATREKTTQAILDMPRSQALRHATHAINSDDAEVRLRGQLIIDSIINTSKTLPPRVPDFDVIPHLDPLDLH